MKGAGDRIWGGLENSCAIDADIDVEEKCRIGGDEWEVDCDDIIAL